MAEETYGRVWDRPPWSAGAQAVDVLAGLIPQSCLVEENVDQTGTLTLQAVSSSRWLAQVVVMQTVLELYNPYGEAQWWSVIARRDTFQGVTTITAIRLELLLRGMPVEQPNPSGPPTMLVSGELTVAEWLATWIVPSCQARGVNVDVGTIEFSSPILVPEDYYSALSLMRYFEEQTGFEMQLRYDSTLQAIVIDFLEEIGQSAATVYYQPSRQLEGLEVEVGGPTAAGAYRPLGGIPTDGTERANMGRAAFRITVKSGLDLTVEAPKGIPAAGLNLFQDGQLDDLYLLAQDGSLHQIDSSTAPDLITMKATPTAFTVGDDVEVRADSSGTLLTDLPSPGTIEPRVLRILQDDTKRGERNHVPNPGAAQGSCTVDGMSGRLSAGWSASGSDSSIPLKELLPSAAGAIAAGDLICIWSGGSGMPTFTSEILTGGTPDGSGNLTVIARNQPASSGAANDEAFVLRRGATPDPTGWEGITLWATGGAERVWQRSQARANEATGAASYTAQAAGAQTSVRRLAVDGLPPYAFVGAGWAAVIGTTAYHLLSNAQADASGAVSLELTTRVTVADNDAVVIEQPDLVNKLGQAAAMCAPKLVSHGGSFPYGVLAGPLYTVRADPTESRLWVSCGIAYLLHAHSGLLGGNYDAVYPSPNPGVFEFCRSAELLVLDQTGATLTSIQDVQRDLDADGVTEVELAVQYDLTVNTRLRPAVRPVVDVQPNGGSPGAPFTMLLWTMVHFGPDPYPPPVDGAWANELWALAQRYHEQASGAVTELTGQNLALRSGYVSADERPTLGGPAAVYSERPAHDRTQRILAWRYNPCAPKIIQLQLDTEPRRLSSNL